MGTINVFDVEFSADSRLLLSCAPFVAEHSLIVRDVRTWKALFKLRPAVVSTVVHQDVNMLC